MPVHKTAVVHPDARLEADVQVGPYCVIGPGVYVGRGTQIGSHVVIERDTRIGEKNRIASHATIGGDPQDLKYDGAPSFVEIGDRNMLREYVTINRGSHGGAVTRLGNDCMLMAGVHIAHDCSVGDRVILANCATLAGHVQIDDRAVIGGLAAFHQFVRVGRLAMVGGTAGVMQDVPPFCMVQGSPPATLRGLNRVGIMRNGASEQSFIGLKQAYRLMFRRGMTKDNALAEIEASVQKTPEVVQFTDWLKAASRRGICRGEAVEDLSVVESASPEQLRKLGERIELLERQLSDLSGGAMQGGL
jgi:UDP-N-acetylglucosamine acyltransferase